MFIRVSFLFAMDFTQSINIVHIINQIGKQVKFRFIKEPNLSNAKSRPKLEGSFTNDD